MEHAIARAEASLRQGERQIAESHYREALQEGWLLLGSLDAAEGRWAEARRRSAGLHRDRGRARPLTLGLVHLRLGERRRRSAPGPGGGAHPGDFVARRLLAQALIAAGAPRRCRSWRRRARRLPQDPELAFAWPPATCASSARPRRRALRGIVKPRPIPQTHVLIGRTYRDFGEYARARAELRKAIALDPKCAAPTTTWAPSAVPGRSDSSRGDRGIPDRSCGSPPRTPSRASIWGRRSWRRGGPRRPCPPWSSPREPTRPAGRVPLPGTLPARAGPAQRRWPPCGGRWRWRPAAGAEEQQLGSIHYQLALALRARAGRGGGRPFRTAERPRPEQAQNSRERLARYLADLPARRRPQRAAVALECSALAGAPPAEPADELARTSTRPWPAPTSTWA